ncbi:UNVERIFIED_CONTAM: hypothetical protein HDU68_001658 [Siphonaria sp. JEL0065]|nr:hypothetical protein HDU68_001658 [Siphonaria sp. JEL0065]
MTTTATAPSCCTLPPIATNYVAKGEVVTLGDLNVYIVGEKGNNAILINYDIFGDHINTRRVADLLSSHGFRVALPDLCRGNPWPGSIWPPPGGFPQVMEHIRKNASFPSVERDMKTTREYLATEGFQSFGLVGFCWGGVNVALLSQDSAYKAGAIIHSGAFSLEDAAKVSSPLLIMPAGDDAREIFDPIFEVVVKKNPASKMRRFDDVHHGFCASRFGSSSIKDSSADLVIQRANEAVEEAANFFKANLREE